MTWSLIRTTLWLNKIDTKKSAKLESAVSRNRYLIATLVSFVILGIEMIGRVVIGSVRLAYPRLGTEALSFKALVILTF